MSLIDKKIVMQLFGTLMLQPVLLSETDKYTLIPQDFNTSFEKYIFSSIYNLYLNGAESISPQDIDIYLNDKKACHVVFEEEKGILYLQDAIDLAQPENFSYYYRKFKKLKLLEDLKFYGYPISEIYCEDLFLDKAQEINEKFEKLEIKDILNYYLNNITTLEDKYKVNQENQSYTAADGIKNLVKTLKERYDEQFEIRAGGGRIGDYRQEDGE